MKKENKKTTSNNICTPDTTNSQDMINKDMFMKESLALDRYFKTRDLTRGEVLCLLDAHRMMILRG